MKRPRIAAETFAMPFTAGEVNEADGTFRGAGIVFGSPVDCWPPTIVAKGAFSKTLQEQGSRVRILWQHDKNEPIGKPISLVESERGLELYARLDPVPLGERALAQIKSGTLTDLSIGFDPIKHDMARPHEFGSKLARYGASPDVIERFSREGDDVRILTEVRLWEISVVTFGAQPTAKIGFSANAFRDLPLATFAAELLDVEAAAGRVRAWADGDRDRASRAFLTGERFQIADVRDGRLVVVPELLYRAAFELQAAAETDEVPARVIEYAREHVASYYHKLGRVAPWEAESYTVRARVESVASLPAEVFEGRVLSAANKTLVEQAITQTREAVAALEALLASATPEPEPPAESTVFTTEPVADVRPEPAPEAEVFDLDDRLREMTLSAVEHSIAG